MDLYKQVKLESSKYVDINSVLSKLNDKGYIQQLGNLLEKIFHEEQAYTIQELSRLMKNLSKDKYFDMDMQFKMNTSIFKANFEVILGILYNNIWSKVTQEFSSENNNGNINRQEGQQQQQQIQQQQQQQQYEENVYQQQETNNDYNGQIQIPQQEQQNTQSQQQKYQYNTLQQQIQQNQNQEAQDQQVQVGTQQQQNQSQNLNKQMQLQNQSSSQYNSLQVNNNNVSGVLNVSGDGWVRKQIKNNQEKNNYNSNLSISQNNNSQFLNKSGVDLYEGKRGNIVKNSSNVNLSILSGKKKTSNNLLQNNSKVSNSSFRSNQSMSKIGGQVPFSETGSQYQNRAQSPSGGLNSSFSRAPRDMDRSSFDQSPGPSEYNINNSIHKVRQASPSTKFGKSARISWIDEKLRYDSSVQTPGAIYDYNKKALSKPLKQNQKN